MPVRFSGLGRPNQIARERARLAAAGVPVTDLTDSNPTRHGLGSPAVLEAVARAAGRAALYDPSPRGPLPAREALAARYGGHPDDYWLTASTSEAYSWLLQLLTDPGDRVAIPAPGYPLIEPLAALALARTSAYPLYYLHPSGWEHDTGRLAELAAAPAVRAVIAVHPGNPTGAYVECGARLHEICARTDCALISDEVFRPFTVDRAAAPASLADQGEALTFALDGLS
ncbi:MAG: pyridoxal phosphate-dependent aminotransferase, partial [Bifidobacteriaceae bacterium]|nr:pyridoxal phosphate-dependent aminotransferase [Bifidobacteriaceae bacterium]